MTLTDIPRLTLAAWPTPIEPLERLSRELGGPRLYVKRDDCTGLGGGGNKIRKLEYLLADARARGCDALVTTGALQSNHARLTAAAAAKLGWPCSLVLTDSVDWRRPEYRRSGNRLIERLLGTRVEIVAGPDERDERVEAALAALRADGRWPYLIPLGGSDAVGTLGYAACAAELQGQMRELGLRFRALVTATGSGGTQAGLVLGSRLAGLDLEVVGISVNKPADRLRETVAALVAGASTLVGGDGQPDPEIIVDDRHFQPGYGLPSEAMTEAVRLCAQLEGLLLDPVYSAKAMAGLIAQVREGRYGRDDAVLFLHTGGQPGLYAYESWFTAGEAPA
ncbi:MAG TPA: D-cysteine desulfhydrase family protein [Azospirillaceae bacterium]|nr:D-cysteine desulfhydrase family protein [Azospirillaceae bacterium]